LPFGQAVNEAVEKRVEWLNLSRQTAKDRAINLHINPVAQAGCSLTFLRILFVFLSDNFSRGFLQAA
jgi:hypothetical protein